jgi:hypothetical protein
MNHAHLHKLEQKSAQKLAKDIPRKNVLRFSLVRQVLWGEIDGKAFGPVRAYSGAGQKGLHPEDVKYKNWNPAKSKTSDQAGHRGGALVPGWWIVIPERLAKGHQSNFVRWGAAPTSASLRIVPYQLDSKYAAGHRGSFYIHGNGGKGSDGCLLIDPVHREALVDLVCNGHGAWLGAYISGTELSDALGTSAKADRTA